MYCHLCTVSISIQVVSIERLVFDVFGQMWGAMMVNGMNFVCTLIGILGACVGERIAIGVVSVETQTLCDNGKLNGFFTVLQQCSHCVNLCV